MSRTARSYLLDISRLISRAGNGVYTGIDRVERAYLAHFLASTDEVHFLSRALGGFVLLRRDGMEQLLPHIDGTTPWGPKDLLSHLGTRQSEALKKAEATMRRLSAAKTPRPGLAAMLARRLSPGFTYINVGHTNQANSILHAIRKGGAGRVAVMVHDVIPLDYPEFARPGGSAQFAEKLRGAVRAADALIYNSHDTAERATAWLREWDLDRPSRVLHLGLDTRPAMAPAARGDGPPVFVALGTIEPRKNHLLLLNIWRRFHDTLLTGETPHLHIVGKRGWENENIVDQLDRAPFMNQTVFERGPLPDDELDALLASARALLFPSFAEGFGYPLIEALAQGIPVIASDLPVFRELAADAATLLDPLDGPGWTQAILDAAQEPATATDSVTPPSWAAHFADLQGFLEDPTREG